MASGYDTRDFAKATGRLSNPTPKPTAEEILRQLELIPDSQLPVTHEEIQQLVDHCHNTRRQAFEQAAEAACQHCALCSGNGWPTPCVQCEPGVAAIRALAEEKPDD